MTKPKKKLSGFAKCVAMVVLLAVIVPVGYMYLSGNGAMESFRQVWAGTEETLIVNDEYAESVLPGEAIRVAGVVLDNADGASTDVENNAADDAQQPKEQATETAESTEEQPSLLSRLLELIFGRENKAEVYE